MDGPGLPDAVGPVHRLDVVLRVPVDVVDDHSVCPSEVDAQPPGPGGEEEQLVLGRVVEVVSELIPLGERSASVQPAVPDSSVQAKFLHEIQEDGELGEEQDLVPFSQ